TAPGATTRFAITSPSSATSGVTFVVSVTALDPYGNTVTGYSGTVHLSSSDASATLSADHTLTNGNGSFSLSLTTAGSQTVTATDSLNALITGTSNSIATVAAGASQLAVTAPA